ncbi:MAG: hypothetical protein M5R42_08810 [Rhodocyclaceae bacterium]|nr:hypothetical protein [Rhodocyclaceae bacterium]
MQFLGHRDFNSPRVRRVVRDTDYSWSGEYHDDIVFGRDLPVQPPLPHRPLRRGWTSR